MFIVIPDLPLMTANKYQWVKRHLMLIKKIDNNKYDRLSRIVISDLVRLK